MTETLSSPDALSDRLRAWAATAARPLRLEPLKEKIAPEAEERAFFLAARDLARDRAGLLQRGLVFPLALLDFVEVDLLELPTGRLIAETADGRRGSVPPRAARAVLDGDRILGALIAPKDESRDADLVPVSVLARPKPHVLGRVAATEEGGLGVRLDRRAEETVLPLKDAAGLAVGDVVRAEVLSKGMIGQRTLCRATERLGHESDAGIETLAAMRLWDLPDAFPAEALAAAAAVRPVAGVREDWRDVAFATIDGASSRDFDDAVFAEEIPGGGWRLMTAIADVDACVPQGSVLDRMARERLTSVYLPHRTLPMLPEAISNGLCSLNPGETRLAMGCAMEIAPDGAILSFRFAPVRMASRARLTYDGVAALLETGAPLDADDEVLASLRALDACTAALASAAKARRLDIHTEDLRLELGPDGKIAAIVPERRSAAQRLVEECMLATNMSAADLLARAGWEGMFRNQPAPDADKTAEALAALDLLGLGGAPAEGDDQRARIASALEATRDLPDYPIVRGAILKIMSSASYEPANEGHYSLGAGSYLHFTSPIRRYPDLVVHRLVKAIAAGREPGPVIAPDALAELCHAATAKARATGSAETEARRMLMADYAERLGGRAVEAAIDQMTDRGVGFLLEESRLEAYLPGKPLEDAGWTLEGKGPYWRDASGALRRPGDRVTVLLEGGDRSTRRVRIALPLPEPA